MTIHESRQIKSFAVIPGSSRYIYPKDPCFDWSLDLVLEGSTTKIEDKQVPGIHNLFQLNFFGSLFFVKRPKKMHTNLRSRYVQPTEPTPKNNNSIRVFNLHPVLRKIMKTMVVEKKLLILGMFTHPTFNRESL